MAFTSAIAGLLKGLRATLTRTGVRIGGTASYPRVEIHSLQEETPVTKDNSIRELTCTIESVSDVKVADVVQLTEDNIALIFQAANLEIANYTVIGIVPGQLRLFEEQEELEQTKVIYRLLQDVTVWVQRNNLNTQA